MNKKISQLQLICIGICYISGTVVVSVFISSIAKNDSWMIGIFGAICFIPVLLVYFSLIKKYPGMGLFEMNEAVFGSIAGRILSFIYLCFFVTLCALNTLEASNFLHYFIMPDTPLLAIALVIMATCVYCVKRGFIVLARVSTLFCIIATAGLFFSFALSMNHANFEFLLPSFDLKPLDYIQSTHVAVAIPFGESIGLMTLIPKLSEKASIKKAYIAVTIVTMLIVVTVHLREVLSLGPMVEFTTLPSYESVRLINLANILSRTESIFALLLVTLTTFKTLILFYACLKGTSQVFRLTSYKPLIFMLAMFVPIYAITAYGSSSANIYWGKNVSPFIWSFFTFLIPLITMVFAHIKGFVQKRMAARGHAK